MRFYIIQKVLSKGLHAADEECALYTSNLMEKLEQTKAELATEDAITDDVAAYAYCEQFAMQTFTKGDNDMRNNRVTEATADTMLAASTFFELLSVWKDQLEGEVQSKIRYAKFHALRIGKALKNGEDPNLTNPKIETPPVSSPVALDPNDPEVQKISSAGPQAPPPDTTYQPYVESAPNTSAQPSPAFSASGGQTAPPNIPPLDTHNQPTNQTFSSHQDVSPISQPANSRQGSVVSVGGGYFPRVDVPTFTAESAPALPTAPSVDDDIMKNPYDATEPPTAPSLPTADPQSFYQTQPSQPSPQVPPVQPEAQAPQGAPSPVFNTAPPPAAFPTNPHPPQPTQATPQPTQPPAAHQSFQSRPQPPHQGPLKTDEEAIMEAQKHAKWAISALNFEDVTTAVKELRTALHALGAN